MRLLGGEPQTGLLCEMDHHKERRRRHSGSGLSGRRGRGCGVLPSLPGNSLWKRRQPPAPKLEHSVKTTSRGSWELRRRHTGPTFINSVVLSHEST